MDNELEKLKQERDEILAKALKLAELTKQTGEGRDWSEIHRVAQEIEALKPKPEIRKAWIHYNGNQIWVFKSAAEAAKETKFSAGETVPMIEAVPIEVPEWEEWDSEKTYEKTRFNKKSFKEAIETFCESHNAEMRRLVAVIEAYNAEVGHE